MFEDKILSYKTDCFLKSLDSQMVCVMIENFLSPDKTKSKRRSSVDCTVEAVDVLFTHA